MRIPQPSAREFKRSLRVGVKPHIGMDGGVWCVSSWAMQRTWFSTFDGACRFARSVGRLR